MAPRNGVKPRAALWVTLSGLWVTLSGLWVALGAVPPPAPAPAGAPRADRPWDRKSAEKLPGLQTSEKGLDTSPGPGVGTGCPHE